MTQQLCRRALQPLIESRHLTTSQKGDLLASLSQLKMKVDLRFAKVRHERCAYCKRWHPGPSS
jgi:hypothetical protein